MSSEPENVTVLVEVDVATCRLPRVHARTYTWLTVERTNRTSVQIEAEDIAMHMAMTHPHVEMVLGARIIDWRELSMGKNEELEARREELYEVFRAGWMAGQGLTDEAMYDEDVEVLNQGFQEWLDEQFAEVD